MKNSLKTITKVSLLGTTIIFMMPNLSSADAQISGCVNNRTGALRISNNCKTREAKISWNIMGPQGPQGPASLSPSLYDCALSDLAGTWGGHDYDNVVGNCTFTINNSGNITSGSCSNVSIPYNPDGNILVTSNSSFTGTLSISDTCTFSADIAQSITNSSGTFNSTHYSSMFYMSRDKSTIMAILPVDSTSTFTQTPISITVTKIK